MAKQRGIFKQKNSKYYWICYTNLDGKIIRESTKTTKFKEALARLDERREAIRKGQEPEPIKRIPNHTYSYLAGEYLKWCERQRSFRSKKGFILQLVDSFGNIPLKHFSTRLIEQYQTDLLSKGNKPSTANRLLATLKHSITKGYQWEYVSEETLKRVRQVKLLPENNRRLRYLSKEEIQTLIKNCHGVTRDIVITALNTGMRKGEILNLKWENIDLIHGFILLDITKNGEKREIPINQTLKDLFSNMPSRFRGGYVFCNGDGKPYQDVKRSFQTALRKAGIKDFHFHDLRHTFASQLVMAGVDITTVSRLLGHKSLTMTLRYSHLAPEHLSKAVNILDSVINENSTSYLLHSLAGNQQ